MKFIIIHADSVTRRQIVQRLNELNHVIVAEPLHPMALLNAIAKHQPHAIIAAQLPSDFTKEVLTSIGKYVPTVPIAWIPENESAEFVLSHLEGALEKIALLGATEKIRPYSSGGQRLVLHDDRYQPFAQEQKLGEISAAESDQKRELEIFAHQIGCALTNHQAARRYLAQLLKTDRGLKIESAYRVVHASYKVFWLREHALRFVGVLAHYIQGVEIEYLPVPAPPSTTLDFVHWEPPTESLYAATALIGHGFRAGLLPGFRAILTTKFIGQAEEQLIADAIILSGWCALLREVALAQVRFIDELLDLNSEWYAGKQPSRRIHRAGGIYGDFWFLPWLRQNPARMRELAHLAVAERLAPTASRHSIAPYRDFLRAHQANQEKSS